MNKKICLFCFSTLSLSAFLPIVSIPDLGVITFMQGSFLDGFILIILSVLGIYFSTVGSYKNIYKTSSILSLLLLAYLIFWINKVKSIRNLAVPNNEINNILFPMNSIRLEWGWGIIFLALTFIFLNTSRECNFQLLNKLKVFKSPKGFKNKNKKDNLILLKEAHKLMEDGILTEDEFLKQKDKLLNKK